jgi:NAD(P)-dependent dehydrogenase (short-subunit alcohol dehydrogenase family)
LFKQNEYVLRICIFQAALNQLTQNLCIELSPQGILAVSINPGWVQTDMGGANASLTKQDSVQGMINVFQKLNKESAAKLTAYDGAVIHWYMLCYGGKCCAAVINVVLQW